MSQPVWTPSPERVKNTLLSQFSNTVAAHRGLPGAAYADIHRWSVTAPDQFWGDFWDFAGVIAATPPSETVQNIERMPGASWFTHARLNYAENLLRRRDGDNDTAIVFRTESGPARQVSRQVLLAQVSSMAAWLRAQGVVAGDRVAAYVPNLPESIIAMLAAASIGAVWSSCSPDFGVQGVLDRFGQIEPTVLITADAYLYAGKVHDCLERVAEIQSTLTSQSSTLRATVVIQYAGDGTTGKLDNAVTWESIVSSEPEHELYFEPLPFDHPLFIMYSSGTTGAPKCIVHGAGGTLLQHLKEHMLQTDVKPGDRLFYFTTTGWMMWNWLVSGLASGATLMLYDGSPFHPDGNVLFDYAEDESISIFGTSAKYVDACHKAKVKPVTRHNLAALRTILSTGSPLMPESYDYIYRDVKSDLCVSSISGGTDIISCFALGNPNAPVYRGELQSLGLGMDVAVLDDDGKKLEAGEKGELSCLTPFPSMPIYFFNDADGSKYHNAYFARFDGVWCHGDYVELTERGGMIIYGRSDAVLNPGGVRIGTAEIYRQAEQIDEVLEGLVIGQRHEGDVRVVLFVRLRDGVTLDSTLKDRIKARIRQGASPRHVPAVIVQVPDIPRTKSGKIVELAVRSIVHGEPVKNQEALANPEALDHYVNLDI